MLNLDRQLGQSAEAQVVSAGCSDEDSVSLETRFTAKRWPLKGDVTVRQQQEPTAPNDHRLPRPIDPGINRTARKTMRAGAPAAGASDKPSADGRSPGF